MRDFFKRDSSAGLVLGAAALAAVGICNSGLAPGYRQLLHTELGGRFGELAVMQPLLVWINDGLMAVFFFLVGIEIKREILAGQLSSARRLSLPMAAAVGGMALPAAIYAAVNWRDPIGMSGWAIPTATDIAFALAALSLLGSRVPDSLRIFLTAVAILDDLGAVAIIAAFYTDDLSATMLWAAAVCLAALVTLNRLRVRPPAAYLLVGVMLWVCLLKSGVHATLAGVATAFAIPLAPPGTDPQAPPPPLVGLERALEPWVNYGILPVFALANAGLSFADVRLSSLRHTVTLGIAFGLFLGKPAGVLCGVWAAVRSGFAELPEGVDFAMLRGAACLCGIGFTMSLFIGSLAFGDGGGYPTLVKLGVILGSGAAAAAGTLLLRGAFQPPPP